MKILALFCILAGFSLAIAQDSTGTPQTPAPSGESVAPAAPSDETPAPASDDKNAAAPADKPAADNGAPKDKIQWTVGMGSVTVDGKQWNRLSLRPDIPLGKFGICLDIEIFVDDSGNISNKGWKFDDAKSTFESITRKIYYLRYGHPGDKFYAKVGALDNVTLGYGLLMSGYSNALQYPDVKKMGLHLELNEISSYGVGIQAMVNNFQDFQNGGALFGTRLSAKPLATTGIPLLKNLIVGGSYVSDMNQQAVIRDRDKDSVPDALDKRPDDKNWAIDHPNLLADLPDTTGLTTSIQAIDAAYQAKNRGVVEQYKPYIGEKDPFSMAGADIGLPIIDRKFLALLFYSQWAMDLDQTGGFDKDKTKGWGLAAPGAQFRLGPVTLNAEYRYFKNQFQGSYYDQTYELDRVYQQGDSLYTKENTLRSFDSTTRSGVFSRARVNIINLLMAEASYQWMKVKDDHKQSLGNAPKTDQSFSATAGFGETVKNVLRKVKIDDINAYYFKKNIGSTVVDSNVTTGKLTYDKFLEKSPTVLMGYKVGFQLSQSMVLYWDTQYTYAPDESSTNKYALKRVKRLNIETVMKF